MAGIAYLSYSVLGGADGVYHQVVGQSAVQSVAHRSNLSPPQVAIKYVMQHHPPIGLIVLSNTLDHMQSNLKLRDTPNLPPSDMHALEALRSPAGRPSYWGDCTDVWAPNASNSKSSNLNEKGVRLRTVRNT